MAGAPKVDLTRPVKSQAPTAEQAAAEAAAKALADKAAADEAAKLAAEEAAKAAADKAAADQAAADKAAADQLASDEAAKAAAAAAVTDTKLVRAIHTVGIAGGKMKVPGDEFELASGVADELEGMGIVAFLEDVEAEEAFAAKKAARKTK